MWPGVYAEWLVEHGAQVIAVDISPRMVALARKRLKGRAAVHLADLGRPLDFLEDGTFDLVLSPLVLDYIEDWSKVFAEFSRLLRDSGLLIFSVEHPFTKFTLHGTEDYFATERVETEWTGFGIRVRMPSYRRPLGAMFAPLAETGFVVERIIEPRPTEAFRRADPEGYERLSKQPGFLCVRARKRSDFRPIRLWTHDRRV